MNKLTVPFANVVDLITFQDHIKDYFLKKGYKKIHFEDSGFVVLDSIENRYGIWNVAQVCAQVPVTEWSHTISGHFEKVFQMPAETDEYALRKNDFSKVKDDLRLQLYPQGYLDHAGFRKEEVVYRSVIPGTLSVVVIDLPSSLQALTWIDAENWDIEQSEIFAIALANTWGHLKQLSEMRREVIDVGDVKINYLEGDDLLTAVGVLNPETMETFCGPYGAIVSIPTRHLVLSYPVVDLEAIKAIQVMGSITTQTNTAGPGALSPLLYWYHNKSFVVLPYSIVDNKFDFTPPSEFISLLNGLS